MRGKTVDIVFANTAELLSLYETSDFDGALKQLRGSDVALGVVTRSEKGCTAAAASEVVEVPAFPVDKVVDTTSARAICSRQVFCMAWCATQAWPKQAGVSARWLPQK